MEDVSNEGGGTAFLPGSHHVDTAYDDVLNDSSVDGERGRGAPRPQPAAVTLAGPAGSVAINWTMVWHTRTPSTAATPRRTVWQVYRRSDQPISGRRQDNLSAAYRLARSEEWAESHPERVMLMDDSELKQGLGWNLEALSDDELAKEMNGSDEFTAKHSKL